ncbi:IDH1, partial [Symbiodinium sp. KB8]
VTESLKVMTRTATLRIAQYAFEYAYLNNRKKVTAVHKVGMMFASAMMLHHLRLHGFADRVDKAVTSVIEDGVALTKDLG